MKPADYEDRINEAVREARRNGERLFIAPIDGEEPYELERAEATGDGLKLLYKADGDFYECWIDPEDGGAISGSGSFYRFTSDGEPGTIADDPDRLA